MTKLTQISVVVIALSLGVIALNQLGLIKPAHAISLNGAIRILTEEIRQSESRINEKIEQSCLKED